MSGYTKLFSSIIASTIWREDKDTKIVWITMLAMADKNGEVEASIPGLADMARVSIDECRSALKCLEAEDEFSRSQEFGGRRIEPVDGGWQILNHAKYRERMSREDRADYQATKQREYRARLARKRAEEGESEDEAPKEGSEALPRVEDALKHAKTLVPPMPENRVREWFERNESRCWIGSDGNPIVKWKPALSSWWRSVQHSQHERAAKSGGQTQPAAPTPSKSRPV